MPALPVIAGHAIVTQHLNADPEKAFINRFCIFTGAGFPVAADITNFAAKYAARLMPLISSDQVMGNTDMLLLDGTSSTVSFTTPSAGTAGGNAGGTDFPEACAQVITWQTGSRGRSKRGRTYLPGVRSNIVTDPRTNHITAGQVASGNTAANGFITDLASFVNPIGLSVLSIKLGVATVVSHARFNNYVGMQRRRYEKVARH